MSDAPRLALFDDGKEPDALRTIGELADALGIKQHVLRYWEQQFPTLNPLKRSGGRRYYRPADIALVQRIDQLVNAQGYTLKGARQALRDRDSTDALPPAIERAVPAPAVGPDILPQLRAIRDRLERALAAG